MKEEINNLFGTLMTFLNNNRANTKTDIIIMKGIAFSPDRKMSSIPIANDTNAQEKQLFIFLLPVKSQLTSWHP